VLRVLLSVSLALAVAGCGGDDGAPAWDGPDRPFAADGTVSVAEFNAYADEVDEPWERSPVLLAGEFLRLDRSQAFRTSVVAEAPGEGNDTATVTATLQGLQDDSVAAARYLLGLQRDGEAWRLASAMWAQSCQAGRGHENFSTELCT
jgi:hypothetical protein